MYLITMVVFLVWPPQRICDGLAVSPQLAGRSVVTDGLGRPHSHVWCLTRWLASGKLSGRTGFCPECSCVFQLGLLQLVVLRTPKE